MNRGRPLAYWSQIPLEFHEKTTYLLSKGIFMSSADILLSYAYLMGWECKENGTVKYIWDIQTQKK